MINNKPSVAVIGLGSMGWGAAASLVRAGYETRGVDIREEILQKFSAAGGIACKTPADAARDADIVFVFVVNDAQTETALFGENGVLETAAPETVIVACATTPPAFAEELGKRLADKGMLPIDAPVSGGAAKALTGEMTIMGSGSNEAFEKAKPALEAIATKIYRLGEDPGIGSRVKMINQLLAGVHIAATAEALTLGIAQGLDPKMLYDVICASAGASWMFENRGPHIVEGNYTPYSAVDIFVKDLGIVSGAGAAANFPLPLTETALDQFKQASAAGLGREDDAAVAKLYAQRGNVKLPE